MKRIGTLALCVLMLSMAFACKQHEPTMEELLGTTTDTAYRNEYFGVELVLPEGWSLLDEAELDALLGLANEKMDNEMFGTMLESGAVRMTMYAMNESGLKSINIQVSKGDKIPEAFLESFLEDILRETVAGMEQSGFTVLSSSLETKTLLDKERPVMVMNMEQMGIPYQTAAILLVKQEYTATITAACYYEGDACSLLELLEGA